MDIKTRRYWIEENESARATYVMANDEYGHPRKIEAFYWVVHGRQGAYQKAHNKYMRSLHHTLRKGAA